MFYFICKPIPHGELSFQLLKIQITTVDLMFVSHKIEFPLFLHHLRFNFHSALRFSTLYLEEIIFTVENLFFVSLFFYSTAIFSSVIVCFCQMFQKTNNYCSLKHFPRGEFNFQLLIAQLYMVEVILVV